ncbi:S8 family serine peptidase [Microseira wollei]|uniref:Protease n=1 Tax=Microseira wollei NIES-4236 TaxID=2530354 RepID=A0AAV3X4B1_9CYAN|nr:S8 family serine peptidase [Microseira wollei]GET36118.1 protease [Microseira wollei NIES-4236]
MATSIPYNSLFGYGLVNASAAVAQAIGQKCFADVPNSGGDNWGLDMVNAPEVWNRGYTGEGIVVAVIDSGVDYTHPDLDDNIWVNSDEIPGNGKDDDGNGYIDDIRGWDFVNRDNDPMDINGDGHGTHVAGIIAAEKNDFGVTGVALNAKIMPVRVLDSFGGTEADIAAGIRYAVDNGADVINLSWGGPFTSPEEAQAIQYAFNKGVVVVTAAGNDGGLQPVYPGRYATDFGITVGSIDRNHAMPYYSNHAGTTPLDYVVAPGVDVRSTFPGNRYESISGTSMAAPYVAGVAALVLSANPNLSPAQVENTLTATANSTGIRSASVYDGFFNLTSDDDYFEITPGVLADSPLGLRALEGNDWVEGSSESDIINGNQGNDLLGGNGGNDTIWGGKDKDDIFGDAGNDNLNGNIGDDFISGGAGDDTVRGGKDNDTLLGGSGNDQVFGNMGNDRLHGYATSGIEYDTLTGGTDSDTFVLGGFWGVSYQGAGHAIITDWEGELDRIEVPGNASQYSLSYSNLNVGSAANDTGIYLGTDLIAIIQDSTDVNFSRDFKFV